QSAFSTDGAPKGQEVADAVPETRETAVFTSCPPELTTWLAKFRICPGLTRIHRPIAVAKTIQTVLSIVSVTRFRMSPYHPNQTAPSMKTVGRSGRQIPSRSSATAFSTTRLKLARRPSEVAA